MPAFRAVTAVAWVDQVIRNLLRICIETLDGIFGNPQSQRCRGLGFYLGNQT